ncbi:hypothetical protein WCX18_08825 [Sulfurimonas sp. HSL1-2]|uniref:ATP-grasp domain-containing protein n=1 Tax=Thiomicrolovo zhangzhouensis TaxID=3131933 RepID=UPI0031F74EE4
MLNVLNLIGAPDSSHATVVWNNGNPRDLKVIFEGTNTLAMLMKPEKMAVTTATFGGRRPQQITLPPADVVVNSVCDPDTNTNALLQIGETLKHCSAPVINPPELTFATTRDRIYTLLKDTPGLMMPKTVRITPHRLSEVPELISENGLDYPYIFRSAGEHGGGGMVLVEREADLPKLERFAFDGRDFYAIAFYDFRDADGLYRKYRLVVIDGKLYPRHLIASTSWNIHAESRKELMEKDETLQNAEKAFHEHPPAFLKDYAERIYEKLPLDFFGIDCHITPQNELFIFELNTCMRVIADKPTGYHIPPTERIKSAFSDLLAAKAR